MDEIDILRAVGELVDPKKRKEIEAVFSKMAEAESETDRPLFASDEADDDPPEGGIGKMFDEVVRAAGTPQLTREQAPPARLVAERAPAAPAERGERTCSCRFVSLYQQNPNTVQQVNRTSPQRQKQVTGADAYVKVKHDSRFYKLAASLSGSGAEQFRYEHRSSCPQCVGRARFFVVAQTSMRAKSKLRDITDLKKTVTATALTVARGDIAYQAEAAARLERDFETGLEIELELEIEGQKIKIKYKPKIAESGEREDTDTGNALESKTGDRLVFSLASKVSAEFSPTKGLDAARASANTATIVGVLGVCACPNHTDGNRWHVWAYARSEAERTRIIEMMERQFDPASVRLPAPMPTPPSPPTVQPAGSSSSLPAQDDDEGECHFTALIRAVALRGPPKGKVEYDFAMRADEERRTGTARFSLRADGSSPARSHTVGKFEVEDGCDGFAVTFEGEFRLMDRNRNTVDTTDVSHSFYVPRCEELGGPEEIDVDFAYTREGESDPARVLLFLELKGLRCVN